MVGVTATHVRRGIDSRPVETIAPLSDHGVNDGEGRKGN